MEPLVEKANEIGTIAVGKIEPGDVVVIESRNILSQEEIHRISQQIKALLPNGVRCVVLSEGYTLKIARPVA